MAEGACCHQDHDSDLAHHHREDAICVDHVSFRYGATVALERVTMHIPAGTRLGIVGPNGGGKSTLLKLVLGLLKPDEGTIRIFGKPPGHACRERWIGYVPQRHEVEFNFPLSVRQVVRLGLVGDGHGVFRRADRAGREAADESIDRVGMTRFADRPIGDLSGGQQQRVFIARALVNRPRILILDEPLVGVDEVGQRQFSEFMQAVHADYGFTLVTVSHDLRAIAASSDQVACLNRRLHFHDAPSGLTHEVLSEVFEHSVAGVALSQESARSSPA
ncbi:MAG: metal ABC transporter ATP-binding protein [Phycisphaerales bacterium]